MWNCPQCASKVDDEFDACWKCGTSAQGEQDPDFARHTDDARDTAKEWHVSPPIIRCQSCGYVGKILMKQVDDRWRMFPLNILLTIAGPFGLVASLWMRFIWYQTCPQCGSHDDLHKTNEQPSLAAEILWQQALAKSNQEVSQRAQWLYLAGLLIFLALILTFLHFTNR